MRNFKHTLVRNLLIIGAWELGKYLGEQLVILSTKNDEVDIPNDFNEYDHKHLNDLTEVNNNESRK